MTLPCIIIGLVIVAGVGLAMCVLASRISRAEERRR